ncbi:hypothetical protein MAPG_11261 [Magnaporthiopsis poae ATCC 64411]|uniref:Histone H1 n=1 Tax=Magnaporthiopsis poae (strain ATCC 64411 / 73-15) TaxID=644358 RepID=A0A0C4EET1_MAGP6|nr:hypothetical protein MAPG_11261 [Magnaporthiopsis poae ATCC 64411]
MAHAPPVSRDGFSFAADCFSVTTSGGNVHRRRSPAELKDHFASKDDQPAHFYEAQLLHYGLAPSKVKGTAKLRLMEAVMATGAKALAVPAPLAALEKEMKKEWAKACKAAAAAVKAAAATAAPPAAAAGSKKRKAAAESATDVQVVASGGGSVSVSVTVNHGTAPKRAKTEPKGSAKKEAAKKETAKKEPAKKAPAKKETAKKETVRKEPAKKEAVRKEPAKKEPAKKEPKKKEPLKKEPVKKEPAKKEPAKKAPAKKEAPKKDPAKKPRLHLGRQRGTGGP